MDKRHGCRNRKNAKWKTKKTTYYVGNGVTRHLYFPIFLLESFGRNHARMKSLYFLSGITFHQILFI